MAVTSRSTIAALGAGLAVLALMLMFIASASIDRVEECRSTPNCGPRAGYESLDDQAAPAQLIRKVAMGSVAGGAALALAASVPPRWWQHGREALSSLASGTNRGPSPAPRPHPSTDAPAAAAAAAPSTPASAPTTAPAPPPAWPLPATGNATAAFVPVGVNVGRPPLTFWQTVGAIIVAHLIIAIAGTLFVVFFFGALLGAAF